MRQLILAVILSVLPVVELRGGLPVAINYALNNNISVWPVFFLIVLANIFVIFLIFLFLDFLHSSFMKIRAYRDTFDFFLERARKKAKKVEKDMKNYGYLALAIFVAIPLPLTGAWTGCLIAWILGLERKKSILAISAGVFAAGIVILIASLGVFGLLK